MSIMGILDIGSQALAAQRTAIDVTGQNISNANIAGYSRQTVAFESMPGSAIPQFNIGNGVRVAAVQRAHDLFLQTRIQAETSSNGYQTVLRDAMAKVEPLFNDTASTGLGSSLDEFFNAWQDLSVNPQGAAERETVLSKAQTLVDDFHRINQSLNNQILQADQSVAGQTADINKQLSRIADLNAQIRIMKNATTAGDNANPLQDSRDQLLQELSRKAAIASQEQDDGTVTVTLGNSSSGYTLVEGSTASVFAVDSTTTDIIAQNGGSGELGGTLLARDTLLPGFLDSLDTLANNLAEQVNTRHAAGSGLDGSSGLDFFTSPTASGYSGVIALNVTSPNAIAAAGGQSGGTGDNQNALALAALKNSRITVSGIQTTLPDLYGALVGDVGTKAQSYQQGLTQSTAMLKQLGNLKESVTGVALDEEMTKLITYQKAYAGAAKLITTGQDMLDTVLNMVR